VEVSREHDERDVNGGQVMGQPARQVDVRDRARLGPEALGNIGERAPETVGHEDHGFAATTPAAIAARRSDRLVNPAQRTYAMQDSIENQMRVWISLTAVSAA